jgi:exosortase/archaeosortase family protein
MSLPLVPRGFDWTGRLRRIGSGYRFLAGTLLLMLLFYAVLYQPYAEDSLPARCLVSYLELVARGSALWLGWLGEVVSVEGTTVGGRFPFVVVLDCAALDAQALFAAAVLAFPARLGDKLLGLGAGLLAIASINIARLVLLYFAGTHSLRLFQVLHEEVLVLLIILTVCGLFAAWARWARERMPPAAPIDAHAARA